uniref:Cytochrome c-553 n=1 Tax=Prymnesium polylepis TaxID=72548 RepID=A0A7S4M3L5_9EUKA
MLQTIVAALAFTAPTNKVADSKVAAVAAVAALTIAAAPAFAGEKGAGASVFNANCAACHVGGQNVILPEKNLQQDALEEYLAGGFNEKAVVTQVTNGKNAMPAFGGRLSDEDIQNVATYVIATAKAGWD